MTESETIWILYTDIMFSIFKYHRVSRARKEPRMLQSLFTSKGFSLKASYSSDNFLIFSIHITFWKHNFQTYEWRFTNIWLFLSYAKIFLFYAFQKRLICSTFKVNWMHYFCIKPDLHAISLSTETTNQDKLLRHAFFGAHTQKKKFARDQLAVLTGIKNIPLY